MSWRVRFSIHMKVFRNWDKCGDVVWQSETKGMVLNNFTPEKKKCWYLLPGGEWLQVSVPWGSEFLPEGPKLSQHARVRGWNVDSPHPSKANSLKRLEWAKIHEPVKTCGSVQLIRPPATHIFSISLLILTTLTVLRVIFVWRKETIYQCSGDYRQMGANSKELEVAHSALTFAVNLNDVKGTSKGTSDEVFPCSKKQN